MSIRPYRDANSRSGSARLLTLSKVTLPGPDLSHTSNLNLKPLDGPELIPSIPCSRTDTIHRPVTRSLSRLATPKEPHITCPRTLRTKNRNPLGSTERAFPLPSSQWSNKSSLGTNNNNNNSLKSEVSSTTTTAPSSCSRVYSTTTSTTSSSMFPSSRVHTRSSSRTKTVVVSNNVSKVNSNMIGSNVDRSNFAAPSHSVSKVSSVFHSSIASKSAAPK